MRSAAIWRKRILFVITIISIVASMLFVESVSADTLYSNTNAPVFYGLTKAIIQQGDSFSLDDSKYRIFARDFEDGDLTSNIIYTSNVDTSKVGSYTILYTITDSNFNTTSLEVPIIVIDDQSQGRYYERTLYSLPSVWNMDLAGTNRGNYQDRQMLGFYMEANSEISIQKLSGSKDLTLTYLNNDSKTESKATITSNITTITSTYKGVPFIKTTYDSTEPVVVGITITDTQGVYSLPYYHYGDSESEFFTYWKSIDGSYSVIENEDITVLVPYTDNSKLVNYYKNCHTSLDNFLYYWHQVINQYDAYLGLSYNPTDEIDQNVKTKYFVKANASGAGSAYYSNDHVGINSSSVSSFFEVNWGGLHEIGHGYQGSLASDLNQGEISNNILGHYVQIDKSIYKYSGNWLGEISSIEDKYQSIRLSGGTYNDLSQSGKLYFIINLLDTYNSKDNYAEINRVWRRALKNNENINTQDAYVLAFYNLYHVNISSYFTAWGIEISDDVINKISDGNNMGMLSDLINDSNLVTTIQNELNKEGKYSLVTNTEISPYNLSSELNITIQIDNIEELIGKDIIITDNNGIENKVEITNNTINVKNLKVGTYIIKLPVPINNVYSYYEINNVNIVNGMANNYVFTYSSYQSTLSTDEVITLKGLGNTTFATISFSESNNMTITTFAKTPHVYFSGVYASIKILDENNNVIYEKNYYGNVLQEYTIDNIIYKYGYKLLITHEEISGRYIVSSTILGEEESISKPNTNPSYDISKYGLLSYESYKNKIDEYITLLKSKYLGNDINNKLVGIKDKALLLLAILKLTNEDKELYLTNYSTIINGSKPINNTMIIKANSIDDLDIYSNLNIIDLEDGIIIPTSINTTYTITKNNEDGNYTINLEIRDSDNNILYTNIELIIETTASITNNYPLVDLMAPTPEIIKNNISYYSGSDTRMVTDITYNKETNNDNEVIVEKEDTERIVSNKLNVLAIVAITMDFMAIALVTILIIRRKRVNN